MGWFIITLIPWFLYLSLRTIKALHMLQQNGYDKDNRYFKWILKNVKKIFGGVNLIPLLLIIGIFLSHKMLLVFFMMVYYVVFVMTNNERKKEVTKKPLIYTARVKRIIITTIILYIIPLVSIFYYYKYGKLIDYYIYLAVLSYLQYLIIMVAVKINIPIEKCVYYYYRRKSIKKLESMSNLKVIGITGSYGKTSSKYILNEILSSKYNTLYTPGNYNTPYGLMATINDKMSKFEEVFIAEMGAYKPGEIKELCDLVHPQYGILTIIGKAHLELFGSQDNIQKTKFELIESLPSNGIGVLNGDDPLQLNYPLKNDCKIKWIGINNKDVDVRASNIKMSYLGTSFDVIFKGDKEEYSFETRLLGYANVYNILASIALGRSLNISIDKLQRAVRRVKPIEHRLELKKIGNLNIIDDAYNSNPVGSKMALEVLKMMPGKRIIITPGMIELGMDQYELNKKFGEYIADTCDEVILVGSIQTKPIQDGLIEKNYNQDNVHIVNDVKQAFELMSKLREKETYVLLENDLPDIFNE